MSVSATRQPANTAAALRLPVRRGLFYGGSWHEAEDGRTQPVISPGNGDSLGTVADAGARDADAAVEAAREGFSTWRDVAPRERGRAPAPLRQPSPGGSARSSAQRRR